VNKNLTLTLDADLLKAARRFALDHDTSVNQMVRDFLKQVLVKKDPDKASLAELEKIIRSSRFKIGKRDWTREDLYERR
jgi:hypothetical protein